MARPLAHVAISGALAFLQWKRTARWQAAAVPFLTGVLVDADHFFDFFLFKARGKASGRIVLPLHGWEFVPLLAAIERRGFWKWTGGSLVLAYGGHLLVDQLTNQITHPLTYSIIFRQRQRFSARLFSHHDESGATWMNQSVGGLWRYF